MPYKIFSMFALTLFSSFQYAKHKPPNFVFVFPKIYLGTISCDMWLLMKSDVAMATHFDSHVCQNFEFYILK